MVNEAARTTQRKERTGIVLSNKMQKTIVVQIKNKIRHPKLGKVMEHATKFKVHDEKNEAKVGDRVLISETRPLSKEKRWRLVEIVQRGAVKQKDELKGEAS